MSSYQSSRQGGSYGGSRGGYRGRGGGGGGYHQGGGGGHRGGYNNSNNNQNNNYSRGGGGGGARGRGGGYRGDRGHGGGEYQGRGGGQGGRFHDDNDPSPHAAFFRDGDFGGAEPSREPEHWYQPYPAIPPHEWVPRYGAMNARTLNLRTDRVPLVIPELRVADDEWGDPRLDAPDSVPAIPLVGWLPVCQRNPGAKWSESQVVSVVTRPLVRQDLLDDELTWPAAIDPEILQRSGLSSDELGGEGQSWLHQGGHFNQGGPYFDEGDQGQGSGTVTPSGSGSRPHTPAADDANSNVMINSAGVPVGLLTAAATAPSLVPEGMVQQYTVARENAKKRMIEVNWQDHNRSAASSPGSDCSGQPPNKRQKTRG